MVYRRCFFRNFDPEDSCEWLMCNIYTKDLDLVRRVDRSVGRNGRKRDVIEFSLAVGCFPCNITMSYWEFKLFPLLFRVRSCPYCQRFCHIRYQCRSTHLRYELCAEIMPQRPAPICMTRPIARTTENSTPPPLTNTLIIFLRRRSLKLNIRIT